MGMMQRGGAWGRLALLCAYLVLPNAVQAQVFHPQTFTLANGLRVVVVKNALSPAITQMVWYKVGSADEARGHSGLAHYLEHLMFRGTAAIPPGAFSRLIAEQGGSDNAFTSYDFTAYHETVASDRLAMAMQMEADRMHNLAIMPATASPELKVVLSERQERTDNSPQGKFAERMRAALYPGHPYGIPVIGYLEEMERMTPEAAMAFYRAHYAPNNAVVVVSGNVDVATVMRLAAGTFGRLAKQDLAPRKPLPKAKAPTVKRVVMKDSRVRQPLVEVETVEPSRATQKGEESYALEVLSDVLDSGEVGLLYRRLVVDRKIASGVSVSYDPQTRQDAEFSIAATPQPGQTAQALAQALNEALKDLARQGVGAQTVEKAKGRLRREAVFARDSLSAPGYIFGQGLVTGETVADIEAWPKRIQAVTAAQVTAALRALVANPRRVVGLLLPDPAPSGAATGANAGQADVNDSAASSSGSGASAGQGEETL